MQKKSILLREFAYARSGDKGTHANVGVIAYNQEGYLLLQRILTTERVHRYFLPLGVKETLRFELPNLGAFNFLLKGILGQNPLRVDVQGKCLGQHLLEMELFVPEHL